MWRAQRELIAVEVLQLLGETDVLERAQRDFAAVEVFLKQCDAAIVHYDQLLNILETLRGALTEKEFKM